MKYAYLRDLRRRNYAASGCGRSVCRPVTRLTTRSVTIGLQACILISLWTQVMACCSSGYVLAVHCAAYHVYVYCVGGVINAM